MIIKHVCKNIGNTGHFPIKKNKEIQDTLCGLQTHRLIFDEVKVYQKKPCHFWATLYMGQSVLQTDTQTDRQTHRQIDRQTSRHTDKCN